MTWLKEQCEAPELTADTGKANRNEVAKGLTTNQSPVEFWPYFLPPEVFACTIPSPSMSNALATARSA